MAEIDARIALGLQPVKINDPLETYGKGLQLKSLIDANQLDKLKYDQAVKNAALEDATAEAFKNATGPNGADRDALNKGLLSSGNYKAYQAQQKAFAETDKLGYESQLQQLKVAAQKTEQLGSLAGSALQMVKSGNVNQVASVYGQAVQRGLMSPEEARQEMGQLNWGDPNSLIQHFGNVQMKAVDALKQIELNTPKLEKVDDGQTIRAVDFNARTNPNPQPVQKFATPGEKLSAARALEIARMNDARVREGQAAEESRFNRRTAQEKTQIVPTDDGVYIVNKGTGVSTPVNKQDGKPLLPKGSPMYDGENKFNSALRTIEDAKKLLPNATGSMIGRGVDIGASVFGKTTKGAEASDALKVLSGALISGVPRFKGSDSDKDVAIYKQLAGNIGDETIPYERRLASLKQVETMLRNNAAQKGFVEKPISGSIHDQADAILNGGK